MKYALKSEGIKTVVAISGNVDDTCAKDLFELAKSLRTAHVAFDMTGLGFVNSMGIANWVSFLEALPPNVAYTFENCPRVFIDVANMIPNFLGQGRVASLQVPYCCPSCKKESEHLVRLVGGQSPKSFEVKICTSCHKPTEAQVSPEDYLLFPQAG